MAAIYKNTWFIKNQETGEIVTRTESFEEALAVGNLQISKFEELLKQHPRDEESSPKYVNEIKDFIEASKAEYKDLVFYSPYKDRATATLWGMIFNGYKHAFLDSRFYADKFDKTFRTLYLRLGSALADKVLVHLDYSSGIQKLNDLGIEWTAAKLYDPSFDAHWAILSTDQFHFLKLSTDVFDKVVEMEELHQDFVRHGLT